MPTIKITKSRFNSLMGIEFTIDKLEELGFQYGIEIEEDTEEDLATKVKTEFFRFETTNNRPDLLCESSLTRALLMYLGKVKCPVLKTLPAVHQIIVDRSVEQIRPFAVGAILRNIKFTPETYKAFIDFQDKLHGSLCRNRTVVSIGTHNLDAIEGPFHYAAKDPKSFKFSPLNHPEGEHNGHQIMTLYENHKLKEYLHIIRDSPAYPLILDSKDRICSLPPIINSDHSKMSADTKNVLIEITATSKPKALICLNTLIWGFAEYCAEPWTVESVDIVYHDHKETTPVWFDKHFTVAHSNAEKLIGAPLKDAEVIEYLGRMGFEGKGEPPSCYRVTVPAWRSDVIHECDILEDIAICYGFQNIVPTLPPSQTIGVQLRLNSFTDQLRLEMACAQFNEALNFALCSKAEMTTMIGSTDASKLITLGGAKTKEFQTGRISLIPGLLKTAVENKSNPMPYKLFEVGDCIIKDSRSDTGVTNVRRIAGLITDEVTSKKSKGLFSSIHGTVDLLLGKIKIRNYKLKPQKNPMFFLEQQAEITLEGENIGQLGILHPLVLEKFGWGHPVAVFELELEKLEKAFFGN